MRRPLARPRSVTRAIAALVPMLTCLLAFRCPGPDPVESPEEGGAGGAGAGPETTSTATTASTGSDGGGGAPPMCDPNMVDSDPMNCGACGRPCDPAGTDAVACMGGVCTSSCAGPLKNINRPPAPAPDDGCETLISRVFVTDAPVLADFGGVPGADATCQAAADAAMLGGTWMAWVSDSFSSPVDRFTLFPGEYARLDGAPIASSWADLIDGLLGAPIELSEAGNLIPNAEVWTATWTDGSYFDDQPCSDWTSAGISAPFASVGLTSSLDSGWTYSYLQECSRDNVRLYCFEQH